MIATPSHDWNALPLPALFDALARRDAEEAVSRALVEDLGGVGEASGDITSACAVPADLRGRAVIASRADGVIAGLRVVEIVARRAGLAIAVHADDGERVRAGSQVATIEGPFQSLLAHERTMLNFLTLLSGNATLAARFVARTDGTRARICDTRKTLPGLRTLQKYATRCGGATLHRIGLFDAVLLKDNHLGSFASGSLAERVRAASRAARARTQVSFVECEVDTLAQLDELLSLERGVLDMVLLDNMGPDLLAEAVRRRDARAPWVLLEASGGITLDSVEAIARSGVDRISAGAITHSAPALDLGLDLELDLEPGIGDGAPRRSVR
ncbi:MAG: hypothetical protein RL136_1242 [Planctomycetota bacterium]|jgi:nicotinate-nucleotide pyrophosphorylase (carboxylating)